SLRRRARALAGRVAIRGVVYGPLHTRIAALPPGRAPGRAALPDPAPRGGRVLRLRRRARRRSRGVQPDGPRHRARPRHGALRLRDAGAPGQTRRRLHPPPRAALSGLAPPAPGALNAPGPATARVGLSTATGANGTDTRARIPARASAPCRGTPRRTRRTRRGSSGSASRARGRGTGLRSPSATGSFRTHVRTRPRTRSRSRRTRGRTWGAHARIVRRRGTLAL